MTDPTPDNVALVHCHDLGRCLGVYGHRDVASPRLDALAADGVLLTRAHATAPLCTPSRGSLFTGRYPHNNGLVGEVHHGWEYRPEVRTLAEVLSASGWHTALFGMQQETSSPARLGFAEYDVSDADCGYVVGQARHWLREHADERRPFLLTAGFFETHRPYPASRYRPADPAAVAVPPHLPDTPAVRQDLAGFYGAITTADAAVGELLDALADTGFDVSTWVVFVTDHGPAFPRAKSTLYDTGTGIAMLIRPPTRREAAPRVYDELFSGVDLVPTLLDLLGIDRPDGVEGRSHADTMLMTATCGGAPVRDAVYTVKTYHDSFDPIRAIRTKTHSYIENYAHRPLLDLPQDIAESPSGRAVGASAAAPRPPCELYDLRTDPHETTNLLGGDGADTEDADTEKVATELALRLNDWRHDTGDVIPSEFAGDRIAKRATRVENSSLDDDH